MTRIKKNGTVSCINLKEYHVESDGSIWELCFYHKNPSEKLFSSSDNFSKGILKDNMYFNFNTCKTISSWEFLVIQQTAEKEPIEKYRWKQNKSPFSATYEDIKPGKVTYVTGGEYTTMNSSNAGGLYYKGGASYFVCANSIEGNWFGAVGCWTEYNKGIPGFNSKTNTTGIVQVFVKIDDCRTKIYKNNDILEINNIVEV